MHSPEEEQQMIQGRIAHYIQMVFLLESLQRLLTLDHSSFTPEMCNALNEINSNIECSMVIVLLERVTITMCKMDIKYVNVKVALMKCYQHMRVSTNTKLANVLKYIGVLPLSQWLKVFNFFCFFFITYTSYVLPVSKLLYSSLI